MNPRGMVGRIYEEDHYKLLQTKYENSRPCGFGEDDFFNIFSIVSLWELSVAVETRVLTDLYQNLTQPFSLLNDALDKV